MVALGRQAGRQTGRGDREIHGQSSIFFDHQHTLAWSNVYPPNYSFSCAGTPSGSLAQWVKPTVLPVPQGLLPGNYMFLCQSKFILSNIESSMSFIAKVQYLPAQLCTYLLSMYYSTSSTLYPGTWTMIGFPKKWSEEDWVNYVLCQSVSLLLFTMYKTILDIDIPSLLSLFLH